MEARISNPPQGMKRLLINILVRALSTINAYPTGLTDEREVLALLKNLPPLTTDRKLIRFGPSGDGGYLVPDDLEGIEACFSPGVDKSVGFEKSCAARGMKVFMADKSVGELSQAHGLFSFTKKYIGSKTNDDFMTLDDWVSSSFPQSHGDLMLQIDIEGYEYEAFLSMSDALMRRFRIIVAEFHSLEMLWSRPFFRLAATAFEKILQTHACVHIHPNNCFSTVTNKHLAIPPITEFTFLRRDRVKNASFAHDFPHPLDSDNVPRPPVPLPECWYRGELP
jgi:hypothetical protein